MKKLKPILIALTVGHKIGCNGEFLHQTGFKSTLAIKVPFQLYRIIHS